MARTARAMFQRSRGTYSGTSRKLELRMSMQIPGGEVGVQKRGVELPGLEPVQELFARFEAGHHVVLLREGHRAGHDPDPFAAKVGQGTDALLASRGTTSPNWAPA